MTDRKEIHVRAAASLPAREELVYQLSDLDHLMPKLYVHMVEVFELDDQLDKKTIVNDLCKGLERTLAEYPLLTGTLHFDNDTRRIVVKTSTDSTMALHVKESSSSEIPSFATLDKHDFPVHVLDSPKVLPSLFVAEHWNPIPADGLANDGPAVAGAQITFIEGGMVLGIAIPHQVSDAMGFERVLATWARYSRASNEGNLNTDSTAAQDNISSRSLLSSSTSRKLATEELKRYEQQFPVMKLRAGPPAPPPADFKMPTVKTRIWHFPRSKLDALKAQCMQGLQPGNWISTYDALLAIMWRATVRAKSSMVKPAPDAPSKAVHAVNARGRTEKPIPQSYIGAAITMPQSKTITISEVLGDLATTLPVLAQHVRDSTKSVTPDYVSDLIKYAAGSDDLRWSELDMNWVLGMDCMAFDWHTMKSYQEHNFGFGTPAAVRWPHPGFEGFFFVLPSRAGIRSAGPDEGIEVCFGLEESCFAELEKDQEFCTYAEQRGVGI